ncbi:hypothetical protein [Actinocorallia aurantiaca]|uniref:Uncharacterized protein n=1 Tax=Actinocorallia aurantiaca TaxID=46204 RepID=A0ABN3UUY9_9ACTN
MGETDPRIFAIVKHLYRLTKYGRIEWTIVLEGDREDIFEYSSTSSTVRLGSMDGDSSPPFFMEIYDSRGIKVESAYRIASNFDPDENQFFDDVSNLYSIARRGALQTDKILDQLLADLEEEGS